MPSLSKLNNINITLTSVEQIGMIEYLYKKEVRKNIEEIINILF